MIYYHPEYFKAQELVSKWEYERVRSLFGNYTDMLILGKFIPQALWTLDQMRALFGSATINNWNISGDRNNSGYRDPKSTTGSQNSDHRARLAFDILYSKISAPEVREHILQNHDKLDMYKYLTVIEDFPSMTWLHIAFRNFDKKKLGLLVVDNKGGYKYVK